MKLLATSAVLIAIAAYFAAPEVSLHIALRGPGPPNPQRPSIVMLGDSHTEFVDWRKLMGCAKIANFGVGGDTSVQMLARLPQVIEAAPRIVFVMAGTNDARRHVAPADTLAALKKIDSDLSEHHIGVVFIKPPPLPSRANEMLALDIQGMDLSLTEDDLTADKIHLRRSAYAKWRDVIRPIVRQFC